MKNASSLMKAEYKKMLFAKVNNKTSYQCFVSSEAKNLVSAMKNFSLLHFANSYKKHSLMFFSNWSGGYRGLLLAVTLPLRQE